MIGFFRINFPSPVRYHLTGEGKTSLNVNRLITVYRGFSAARLMGTTAQVGIRTKANSNCIESGQ